MADLSLRGLRKRYGAAEAVAGVSLEVAEGELFVLLGPSGSGKSTILKMVAGIESPDEGEIWIDGRRVDQLLPRARDVAMVFQSYALYPHMSVRQNLAFPLGGRGLGRDEVARKVAEVASLLELDEALLGRRPIQLSGGQQQRVALGRAIIRQPKLFLMDEPLSNLDAKLRARTRLELTRLHERLDATTVFVTHDQVEALTMGDRIAVLDAGRLHQVGAPEAVYDHPADRVVAEFLGSPPMNFLDLSWSAAPDDGVHLSGDGVDLRVARCRLGWPDLCGEGGLVVLGMRPEHLRLATTAAGRETALAAVVERVELLGADRLVHVVAGAARLAVRVDTSVRPAVGDAVVVALAVAGIRLFDPATGRALS
ncbi:MAG: ABC transporter ATP-binding protein, partial [Acidimicrobiales bacterium]